MDQTLTSVMPEERSPICWDGARLALARGAWLALTISALTLYLASIPAYYARTRDFHGAHQDAGEAVRSGLQRLGVPLGAYAVAGVILDSLIVLTFAVVGSIVFRRASREPRMLFFSGTLVVFGAIWPNTMDDLAAAHPLLLKPELALNALGFGAFFLLFYLFPDGRFVPGWTRWVALLWALFQASTVVMPTNGPPDLGPVQPLLIIGLIALFPGTMLYAQIHRYRHHASAVERQQAKWVTFALLLALVGFVATASLGQLPIFQQPVPAALYNLASGFVYTVAFILVPVAVGLSVLRHRLWDIDPLIGHTLVYGALTVCVVGLYVLVVGELGVLFQTSGNLVFSLLATGLVAVVFQPLRLRLQRGVNRLIYGRRDDPYAVLAGLDQRLEATLAPETVLPTVVETVREALKLPHVAIALRQGAALVPIASAGTGRGDTLRIPLIYQHEPVGELRLAPRTPGEAFNLHDRQLLDDLARRAAVAVYATRVTSELQRSREQLVTAREEERRRLRRDLHDGLGPRLAGLVLRLETARGRLEHDPLAGELLTDLAQRTQEAVADIRRLVYALRPPALDELGLASALEEVAVPLGLTVMVAAPSPLPPLPAAVEVAAFRIGQEALTNVARHAGTTRCWLTVRLDERRLELEVRDDGAGIDAERRAGVGLASMRERAEELGGSLTVVAGENGRGTIVRGVLPRAERGQDDAAAEIEIRR